MTIQSYRDITTTIPNLFLEGKLCLAAASWTFPAMALRRAGTRTNELHGCAVPERDTRSQDGCREALL